VVVLKLSKEFFNLNQNKIKGLKECIELGHMLIEHGDHSYLDYEIHKSMKKESVNISSIQNKKQKKKEKQDLIARYKF
jgi:hypothetical protein